MPPFLMLIGIVFVVLMVMFGNNPVDKWRAEAEKYGREPLARDIKKFNEKNEKDGDATKYKPPPGATVYRLPPGEAQLQSRNPYNTADPNEPIRPAPDVPIEQWDAPYPSYMYAPGNQSGTAAPSAPRTSMLPGR